MGHSTRLGQVGPGEPLGWPLAEGEAFGECLQRPSAALFTSSLSTRNPPLWLREPRLAGPSGSCRQRVWLPAEAGWAAAWREEEGVACLPPPPPPLASLVPLRSSQVLTVLPSQKNRPSTPGSLLSPPWTFPFWELTTFKTSPFSLEL